MTTKKIYISLPEDLYDWVRSSVDAGQADSVSERIATVLAAERTRDLWLAEQERVFGALPADPDADAHGKERPTAVPP